MSKERSIRAVLADDHTIVRQGIAEMLSVDGRIEVVGQAGDGAQAVELAGGEKPDVVLLDVEMPGMEATEAIGSIKEASPSTRIIILTTFDDPRLARELLASGASAYLVKSATRQDLVNSIRLVADGEDRVVLSMSREALDDWNRREGGQPITNRELETLVLVARGMSNRQIASSLYLTEGTVKRHLYNLYSKLGVTSRSEATRKALLEGIITARDITNFIQPDHRTGPS